MLLFISLDLFYSMVLYIILQSISLGQITIGKGVRLAIGYKQLVLQFKKDDEAAPCVKVHKRYMPKPTDKHLINNTRFVLRTYV